MAKNKVIEGEKELNKKLNVEQITWDGLTRVNIEKPTTKETVEIYKDTDYILSQDRLQKIMAILTVFMATIMPIEVIASVEGSNALPASWHNNTTVFGVFIGLQVITLFIMLYLFRRRHWI